MIRFLTALCLVLAPALAWALNEDAEGQAARICYEQGLPPSSAAFSTCVANASRAIERGEPNLARAQARGAASANEICRSYGIEPNSLGYRQCLINELERAQPR